MPLTDYTGLWKLLYDWQTIIAGAFALLAALIGAVAAYRVGAVQVRTAKQKDQLQAQCIAVAITPELLQIEVRHQRATEIINEVFLRAKREGWATDGTVSMILSAQIEVPPLLSRTIDQLYILEGAGPTLLQLISVTLQYNSLIRALAQQIRDNVDSFNPPEHKKNLSGQLQIIEQDIAEAQQLVTPIHDQATAKR